MKKTFVILSLLFLLIFTGQVLQCQELTVQTSGKHVINRADLEALPHVKVTASEHSSSPVDCEGVTPRLLMGIGLVIALPELDPAFTERQTVLAFSKGGKPLDEQEGPYRIVIPDEKRMARWVRQVTTLKIVAVQ